jgi:hypothetical protein
MIYFVFVNLYPASRQMEGQKAFLYLLLLNIFNNLLSFKRHILVFHLWADEGLMLPLVIKLLSFLLKFVCGGRQSYEYMHDF